MAKIIMVCGRSPANYYGGIEDHILQISRRLVEKGYDVEIYSTLPRIFFKKTEQVGDLQITNFPSLAPRETYYLSLQLLHALRKVKCEIIHGHGVQDFSLLGSALSKRHNKKVVLTLHTAGFSSLITRMLNIPYRTILKRTLKNADKIICVSESERQFCNEFLKLPNNYFTVIPNGVDEESLFSKSAHHLFPQKTPFILAVTRLEKYKGCHYILESFAKLRSYNLKLVIVGSGPHKDELLQLAKNLRIENNTIFLGNISKDLLISLYQDCKLFINLSAFEACPLTILDALSLGKPVITTNSGSSVFLREITQKGWAVGVPYPPQPEFVAKKILEIVSNPSKFVPRDFAIRTWDDVVQELEKLYSELLIKK